MNKKYKCFITRRDNKKIEQNNNNMTNIQQMHFCYNDSVYILQNKYNISLGRARETKHRIGLYLFFFILLFIHYLQYIEYPFTFPSHEVVLYPMDYSASLPQSFYICCHEAVQLFLYRSIYIRA